MLSSGVCCSQVLCASPWESPDRGARRVSSWGIRMELLRITMRALCHQGEGSLHLAHVDGPPCDARHNSFHPGKNSVRPTFHLLRISHIRKSVRSDMSESSDRIFHIQRLTFIFRRGGCFNFPGQTCPDPPITLTRRVFLLVYSVAVFSWSFLIFPTDFLRYFVLDIWCLNPQTLLVTHLS